MTHAAAKASILATPHQRLVQWLEERRQPAYRAGQIRQWIFRQRAGGFAEMTVLPASLREELAAAFDLLTASTAHHQRAHDGTEKLLLALADGARIECVLLRDGVRRTICISTQVGCAMGCVFCASGLAGVERNLTSAEILEQMLHLQRLLPADQRLSHIVVMGMGEPLANLDRLLPALEEASSPEGLGISARRITISTVGLPAAIRRLASMGCRYHLAVSLHAPSDNLRRQLVPVSAKIPLAEVLAAADAYFDASGRRLTFEYVLLDGVNDRPHHARQLARLLAGRTALVNLIPYNPVAGLPYAAPSAAAVAEFRRIAEQGGLSVQVREKKGDEISAACGQLRRQQQTERPRQGAADEAPSPPGAKVTAPPTLASPPASPPA